MKLLQLLVLAACVLEAQSLVRSTVSRRSTALRVVSIETLSHLLADESVAAAANQIICPNFGEPGWAPFCFLNGNPVFNAFDQFQAFIQNSVVSLHDTLNGFGIKNSYGPSIITFTIFVRLLLFPLTYNQLASTQNTQALTPKVKEIKDRYPDNKELQNQLVALLYSEAKVNPLAGCLPALAQIPVFIALYRSFLNLATTKQLDESFLWLPDLDGPVYGERSADWLFANWNSFTPSLGWHDTIAYLTIPALLIIAQTISLRVLTPPSDDPAIQQSQRILKYLPLLLGYFSLSVPAGLGVYWITNNILSTVTTAGIKEYFKRNPVKLASIDIDSLMDNPQGIYMNPTWGYSNKEQMIQEAKENKRPSLKSKIPLDFV
jgi:YidC/Oxa1 family membrane protein insertase